MQQLLKNNSILVIAIAQCFGTSLWFAGNAVIEQLIPNSAASDISIITNLTLAGFITGTLVFAATGLSDRFKANRVFAVASLIGAAGNLLMLGADSMVQLALLRFVIGLCLAGIYPVGMKLAVVWNPQNASLALGWLVGMLVLGTALPHGLQALAGGFNAGITLWSVSALAITGAILVFAIGLPEGYQVNVQTFNLNAFKAFKNLRFRAAALGYFGHMWELYAFWALVPLLISTLNVDSVSLLSFVVIAIGTLGCIVGGYKSVSKGQMSQRSSFKVARVSLLVSGACCLIFPTMVSIANVEYSGYLGLLILLVWGATVVSDSPMFSALSSNNVSKENLASALSLQNSIGFSISMVTIFITMEYWQVAEHWITLVLLPGPILGFIALGKGFKTDHESI